MDYDLYSIAILLIALILILFLSIQFFRRHLTSRHRSALDERDESNPPSLQASLAEEEQELIQNIKEFQDGIVREVMIPRIDIVAVEEATSLEIFHQIALGKGHSRIPVYRETIDHIVGIAYVKDMLCYWNDDATQITVAQFMRTPYFIPDTKNIDALLHEFQAKKVHIAVAIDEYGGTAGIVTIEDLLEVVFGNIVDEHDEEEEERITVIDDHTIEISAKADIDELEEYMGELVIEFQDFETVGGLLVSILGDIPKPGDTVTYQHLKFTILDADKHRIVTVKVERIPENAEIPLPHKR
jgi:CBS domain containing-hemolysin-like protein